MSGRWYALRAAMRHEFSAEEGLKARGFEVFLPVEVRWRRTKFAKTKVRAPLFLGYLFVRCQEDQMRAVREVDGVHHFVGWLDEDGVRRVAAIRDDVIDGLAKEEASGIHDHTRSARRAYRPARGERVKFAGGRWSGILAQALLNPAGRANLMLEGGLGGRVSADAAVLTPA